MPSRAAIPAGAMGRRARLLWVAGAFAAVVLAGCGSAQSASPVRRGSAASAAPAPPRRLAAARMSDHSAGFGVTKPGTVISGREVDARVFADSRHGFGLANIANGETFPAATTNGGGIWRIDGPVFHVPAANGAAGVGYTGVAGLRTYFAYGSSAVNVTTDGGKTWWQTLLGELVLAVVAERGG